MFRKQRDQRLLEIAEEALSVYWGPNTRTGKKMVCVKLPVLDGEIEFQVSVAGGVFTIKSQMPGMRPEDFQVINEMNGQMPEAAFSYVAIEDHLYLQSKIAIPDLDLEDMRPPALGLAWSAGWSAARGGKTDSETHLGPSSYDQFVYLADLLACAVHQQWSAQQGAAQILMED